MKWQTELTVPLLTESQAREKAKNNLRYWRLIMSEHSNLTYEDVFYRMDENDISEANAVLDLIQEEIQKKNK